MRLVVVLTVCLGLVLSTARGAEPSPEAVKASIDKAKKYLYGLQNKNGTWDDPTPKATQSVDNDVDATQWGGQTAMAVYALLVCGEKANDPKLAKAIEFLHTQSITGTYAVSMKCQVWMNLPATPEVKKSMARDSRLLFTMVKRHKGDNLPVWDYGPSSSTSYSLSRTQYATLGLWAGAEMGIEFPDAMWKQLEQTWEKSQTPDGGWQYMFSGEGKDEYGLTTASMTAAGLASLYLAQDFTKGDTFANAKGNPQMPQIDKAVQWLAKNFEAKVTKPLPREFTYAQLYAIERVGLASGLRRFGPHDWYAKGAEWLISKQAANGGWGGDPSRFTPVTSASWSMLFLQRGRTPVAFNKLDYTGGVADPKKALWNQRPRDVANVTRWLSRTLEQELRWQVVASDSTLEALLESPVMYISGDGALQLKPEAKALLKKYVDHGGLILAHADTGDDAFSKSVLELGGELFKPNEWRELPESHPLYTNQNFKLASMKSRVPLRGISNGVRELMLLIPSGDPARVWQLRNANNRAEAWQTAANILSYAVDKNNYFARGESWLAPAPAKKPTKTIAVGQLQYNGVWNPEPEALTQLSNYLAAKKGASLDVKTIEAGKPIEGVKLLLVSGTRAFSLPDDARTAIKAFTDKGGTVLFEASGGNGEFASSAEVELNKIYGAPPVLVKKDHAMYGADLKVEYRPFNIMSIGNPLAPALRGVEKDGRFVALLSREDLSAGWLGVPTDGIVGYKPDSARAIMAQVLTSLK